MPNASNKKPSQESPRPYQKLSPAELDQVILEVKKEVALGNLRPQADRPKTVNTKPNKTNKLPEGYPKTVKLWGKEIPTSWDMTKTIQDMQERERKQGEKMPGMMPWPE